MRVTLILAFAFVASAISAAAAERLRAVTVTTSDAQVRLYDSVDGAATSARAKVGFPEHVYVLGESDTGRLRIRFPDTGQTVWVRGRDVRVSDAPARPLECDPITRPGTALAAAPTRGARGAGIGECR